MSSSQFKCPNVKIINQRSIAITLALYALAVSSCNSQSKDPDKEKIRAANTRIEQQVGQFDPAFTLNPKNTHIAVQVNYENGAFQLATPAYTMRPGKMPYPKDGGGDFIVALKDAADKSVGRYFMENPTAVRVCDREPAPPTGSTTIAKGSFDLLLPNDRSIASVEFIASGKSIGRLSVPLGRMQEVKEGNDNNPADTATGRGR